MLVTLLGATQAPAQTAMPGAKPTPAPAAAKPAPAVTVAAAEKKIVSMREILKRLLKEVAAAREANDVRRLNCLIAKLNLVKGLLKASERAQVTMLEATYANDAATGQTYGRKILTYGDSAEEIERSIDECSGVEVRSDGAAMVYVRPDTPELQPRDEAPWDTTVDVNSGPEGYPVVPPASPFR
jgi:hypothetical protein